ncbi:MAG TPA: beta-eliminating lyase-related protein [Thermoanaerobaculia bacterium]|jgi:threonine aldolase
MIVDLRSDNTRGASPEIVEAVARANRDAVTSYGGDPWTARLQSRVRELFETDAAIFPVLTGTAGNALAIAAMTSPSQTVVCHADAHIVRDEEGAPELLSGGATMTAFDGADGKLHDFTIPPNAACLSLTNATEAGTVYSLDELRALCERARAHGLRVHLDGARFANAFVTQRHSLADVTWRAGIDVLVLGGTKNGALGAELVIVFDRDLAQRFALLWHRSGHRLSKLRFLSAQLEAYLTDDLWLRNARHANAAAARLAAGLRERVEIVRPVEANILFARLQRPPQDVLMYDWPIFGENVYRMVTAFDTRDEEVDAAIAALLSSRA